MAKDKGFIPLYRNIRDHWVWQDKPYSKGQAWIDLLLKANHSARKMSTKGGFLEIQTGQLVSTERHLADDWGWSRGKVRTFIYALKSDQMLAQEKAQGLTVTTVCNYREYRFEEKPKSPAKSPQEAQEKPKTSPRKALNNNYNNCNKKDIYPDWLDMDTWKDFLSHRKHMNKNKPISEQSEKINITELKKYVDMGYTQEEIINKTIAQGWKGFFKPKDPPKQQAQQAGITYKEKRKREDQELIRMIQEAEKNA